MVIERVSPTASIAQKPAGTTNIQGPLTLTARRRAIRAALEAAGYAVYGRSLTIDGKRRIVRFVLPLKAGAA